jgi:hypothetical protein
MRKLLCVEFVDLQIETRCARNFFAGFLFLSCLKCCTLVAQKPLSESVFDDETIAQSVEHLTFNERVDGSSPSGLTTENNPSKVERLNLGFFMSIFGVVVQPQSVIWVIRHPLYSYLNASIVSIFAAFRAGHTPKMTPVKVEMANEGTRIQMGARISNLSVANVMM